MKSAPDFDSLRSLLIVDSLSPEQRTQLEKSNTGGDPAIVTKQMREAIHNCGVPDLTEAIMEAARIEGWQVGKMTQLALARMQVVMLGSEGWNEMEPMIAQLFELDLASTALCIGGGLANGIPDIEMYSFISNQWKNTMYLLLQRDKKRKSKRK